MQHDSSPALLEAKRLGLDSAALARLMDEVRNDVLHQPTAYNRMHNRHNR